MKLALLSLLLVTSEAVSFTPSPTLNECVLGDDEDRMCERTFLGKLGAKNGVSAQSYIFRKVKLTPPADSIENYSDAMLLECDNRYMKPVCDKKSFCGSQDSVIYLGQTSWLANPAHRNHGGFWPTGWPLIKNEWDGLCAFSGAANGKVMCQVGNGHEWSSTSRNPGFMCAKRTSCLDYFTVALEGKNGVPSQRYEFCKMKANDSENNYSANMIAQCGSEGFQPVCDHPRYCKNDANSLYIGQDEHLAHSTYRNDKDDVPAGFASIANKWISICSYTASWHGNSALCNVDTIKHVWKPPVQMNPGFICGRIFEYGKTEAPTRDPTASPLAQVAEDRQSTSPPTATDAPTAAPTVITSAPTRGPTVITSAPPRIPTRAPTAITRDNAAAICEAAEDKKACGKALTRDQGKCKFKKSGKTSSCKLKAFFAVECNTLIKRKCKKAVKAGICSPWDKKMKSCVDLSA